MIKFRDNILIHFFCFLLCLFFVSAKGQDPNTLFLEGNKYYEKEDFSGAINNYEKIIELGYESTALFYNLGNACFKSGKLGAAILYYEKAKKINPADKDVSYNLTLANTPPAKNILQLYLFSRIYIFKKF